MVVSVSPVRTEEEYEAALRRIRQLFHSDPGTPEFDELEILGILVEAYEKEHYPIDPPEGPSVSHEVEPEPKEITQPAPRPAERVPASR